MDSYRPHQQQQYMRPPLPPPATSDPYHYQQQQPPPPPPPRPPLPQQQQQGAWYSNPNQNQYQYHSLQSPSPPPPQQWGPPPHADHLPPPPGSYPPPPPPPYSAHHYRPHGPPQSYHPQEWAAQSRPNNQVWDYPAHNNEQDWAAKARAWAARTAMENQDQQSQFTAAGRPEEQTQYHEQYPQSQHQSLSASSYQQVPVSGTPTHRPLGILPQDTTFIGSEPSSYGHHTVRSAIPSVHQQEVPSSYSSVTGNDASAELNEHSYNLLPMPNSSGQEGQHHMQQSHAIPFGYGSHSADPATNLADQPLEFASGFNSDHGAHASSYPYHDSGGSIRGVDPATTVPSMNSWTVSVAPGVVYPPTLPVLPSGPQHDPSMTIPSPVPGNAPHSFGSFPGLSLQPTIPTTGPPFALTAGTAGHPTVAFPGDAYGVSTISERPKKAAVPNWLREEIKKVSITNSTMDHLKEETQSVEDEGVDRSFGKGDQADSKSIDSSRSTEEEDDEDEVEAARTAAINKEIKRILTEVLSTVTDELFDEIATKVLSEDDLTSEVGQGRLPSNHKVLPSTPAVSDAKASAKLLIPVKTREPETEDVSEKFSSSTPGDILGLANYATDDDDDDDDGGGEIPSSGVPKSGKDQFTVRKPHESHDATANGSSPVELEEHRRSQTSLPDDLSKSDISYNRNKSEESNVDKYLQDGITAEPELSTENVNVKKTAKNDPQSRESRMKPDKHDRHGSKRSSFKENEEVDSGKIRTDEKGDENRRRQDERPLRKGRTDDRNGSKEKIKDQNVKPGDKAKESDSRKRSSHADVEEDKRETDRLRSSSKEDVSRKRERTKNKEDDRSRRKHSTDSSRHKRRRSSSIDSKDNSVNHANHSSDDSSEDSKRKLHSRRRHSSPSPVRSRRRQVSRSPHSKHSQRRHSPYSSLDSNRGKGSRSRSPAFGRGVSGLWSVWLCGFALIGLSFYATQRLPSIKDQIMMRPKLGQRVGDVAETPRIIIFSAPRSFSGSVGDRQSLALRSWLALSPEITVVLFSKDPSVVSFAQGFGSRVVVDPNIDFTFLGTPFFHSMMARTWSFSPDISVLVDPETIVLPDFISTLNYAYNLDDDWLLVASSQNVSYFPFYLDEDGKHWRREDGKSMRTHELQEIIGHSWQQTPCEQKLLMAWNCGDLALYSGVLPPFLYGRGVHNSWVINEALSSELRFVFDASWTISSLYLISQEHLNNWTVGASDALIFERRSWEYAGNSHVGALYGSLSHYETNNSSLIKLLKCDGQYIFVNKTENICSSAYRRAGLGSWWKKKSLGWVEGVKSQGELLDCTPMVPTKHSKPLDYPFSLETLLPLNADKNKTIVLAAAGYSYKDMLMSWVCRMRHLQITNFIICALDQEIYEFSVLMGLPVFRDPVAPSEISFNDCHFGTKCFQKVTKVKSRMVLKILKMGYNVLLSDVDVYWFGNPLPLLWSFGPAVLAAQSDEFNKTGPINLPRRLNSGFYFARSDSSTIAAMKKVVAHAATSGLSEQPSFYDTLCGEGGSNRVGANRCLEPETNLTVHFLDRDLFPNGAYLELWHRKNVRAACVKQGCLVLHNNWISGRLKKLERQVLSGLWDFDTSTRMCQAQL
ncbi:transcription elongation regulator 1 [Rosa sericea]